MDLSKPEVHSIMYQYSDYIIYLFRYDPAFQEHKLSILDILRYKAGVCREFVLIFVEMCEIAGVKTHSIQGFARGSDYKPGS